jgi:hypothetical protein
VVSYRFEVGPVPSHGFYTHFVYKVCIKCARKIILGLNRDVPLLVLLCGGNTDMVGLLFEKWHTNFIICIFKNLFSNLTVAKKE